nr:hypothetical protein BgiMline_027915 [Biomphalaria glabrata]
MYKMGNFELFVFILLSIDKSCPTPTLKEHVKLNENYQVMTSLACPGTLVAGKDRIVVTGTTFHTVRQFASFYLYEFRVYTVNDSFYTCVPKRKISHCDRNSVGDCYCFAYIDDYKHVIFNKTVNMDMNGGYVVLRLFMMYKINELVSNRVNIREKIVESPPDTCRPRRSRNKGHRDDGSSQLLYSILSCMVLITLIK